jgi:hypothetical protein
MVRGEHTEQQRVCQKNRPSHVDGGGMRPRKKKEPRTHGKRRDEQRAAEPYERAFSLLIWSCSSIGSIDDRSSNNHSQISNSIRFP